MPKRNNESSLLFRSLENKHECLWHRIDHFIIIHRVWGAHYRFRCGGNILYRDWITFIYYGFFGLVKY